MLFRTLLIAIGLACAPSAPAWSGPSRVADLPSVVETELGTLSGHELSGYCTSPNIVIVRVESLRQVHDENGALDHSRIQLRVQTVARSAGDPLAGALLEVSTVAAHPRERLHPGTTMTIEPVLDSVWVLGFTRSPKAYGSVREGDPLVRSFRPLRTAEEVTRWTEKLPNVLELDCWSVRPL